MGPKVDARGRNLRESRFIGIDLSGARFDDADLTGVGFVECKLDGASFRGARLENTVFENMAPLPTDVDFSDAVINGMNSRWTHTGPLSYEQFVSTYSYKRKLLQGVHIYCGGALPGRPQHAYDFKQASLIGAVVYGDSGKCDFTGAFIRDMRGRDLRIEAVQLAATADFQSKTLSGLDFSGAFALRGKLDLTGMKLERVQFGREKFDANFDGVRLVACTLGEGLTHEQLRATSNFRGGDLSGLTFRRWNFDGYDLAGFDLSDCVFDDCSWRGTDVTDAVITGSWFSNPQQNVGWSNEQLQSTWSYRRDRLDGLRFTGKNGAGPWDFSGKSLRNAAFSGSFTDLNFAGSTLMNVVFDGTAKGVNLRRATIDGLSFGSEAVFEADFRGAKLRRADFRELMFGVGKMLDGATVEP
jgi:uncharacterized protein YjbI with pentapeptide repeats